LMLAATLATIVDSRSIWLFGVTTFVITWGSQLIQSSNQTRVLQANPDGPAQANTMFMVFVFAGGSVGALLGSRAYALGGMPAVGVLGVCLVLLGSLTWLLSSAFERRREPSIAAR
jgi:predicted MFS family arabinose efflux permease